MRLTFGQRLATLNSVSWTRSSASCRSPTIRYAVRSSPLVLSATKRSKSLRFIDPVSLWDIGKVASFAPTPPGPLA
jgi:hypothetical protein